MKATRTEVHFYFWSQGQKDFAKFANWAIRDHLNAIAIWKKLKKHNSAR